MMQNCAYTAVLYRHTAIDLVMYNSQERVVTWTQDVSALSVTYSVAVS